MYSCCQRVTLFFSNQLQRARIAFVERNTNQLIENIGNELRDHDGIRIGGFGFIRHTRRQNNILINLGNQAPLVEGPVIGGPARQAREQPQLALRNISLHSAALEAFVAARRRSTPKNDVLSENYGYDAMDCELFCPILRDFPLIPVLFNGKLYDYDALINTLQNGFIEDSTTQEQIKLAPHVIQPYYEAQKKMDNLLKNAISQEKNKQAQVPRL